MHSMHAVCLTLMFVTWTLICGLQIAVLAVVHNVNIGEYVNTHYKRSIVFVCQYQPNTSIK